MMAARDKDWMSLALELARQAASLGEVPVGAVLVHRGVLLGWGYNRRESNQSPLGHAELMAIEMASRALGHWRLEKSTLYVTLEPCAMCSGAILQARIPQLVFGSRDPKAGAVRSLWALLEDPRSTHRVVVREGILAQQSRVLLKNFFAKLRSTKP